MQIRKAQDSDYDRIMEQRYVKCGIIHVEGGSS
jgi:hypothetical protein